MIEKKIESRVRNKHDTQANWEKAVNFVPLNGEIIIYDIDENHIYPRVKIGDGTTKINELPFVGSQIQLITWEDGD